jgi:hypothetical protein
LHERSQEIHGVRPSAAGAVRHPRLEEQPGEFLRAMQTFLSLSVIVPAIAGLTGHQSFVIIYGVQRRYHRIGKAMKEKQLAAA